MHSIKLYTVPLLAAIACIIAVIVTFSMESSRVDNRVVVNTIQHDLETGAVAFPDAWNRNEKTGVDTWTDCLVLEIATFGDKSFFSALTRSEYPTSRADIHPCNRLSARVGGISLPDQTSTDYWRYWWGSAALLNIGIGVGGMNLPAYQAALKAITYLTIVLVTGAALIRYRRAGWSFVPVAFALLFGFEIPLFGQSVAHAPSLIVGLLLLFAYIAAGMDRAAPRWQFAYFFLVGGLVFYFELLNGNLVAILVCCTLIRLISVRTLGPPQLSWPAWLARWPTSMAVACVTAAYFGGAVVIATLRILLRVALTRQSLFNAAAEWHAQIAKHTSPNWLKSSLSQTGTLKENLFKCYYDLEAATFPYIGRHETVAIYALCALIYFILYVWLLWRVRYWGSARRDTMLAAAFVVLIVPAWYCAFTVHAVMHSWMMMRLLALFFALAPSVALIALTDEIDRQRRVPEI